MEQHQKSLRGNTIILAHISRYFRFPHGFDHMVYLSQVQQAYSLKMAVEYWRSQRPRCIGTVYWQLQDSWPGTSWSSIEYSGKLRKFDGTKVNEQVFQPHLPAEGVCKVAVFPMKQFSAHADSAYLHIKLSTKDILIENSLFLTPPKWCNLYDPDIQVEIGKVHDGFILTFTCRAPAFSVAVDAHTIRGKFSENMFDIRPTASKTIRFTTKEPVSLEKFTEVLAVRNLYGSYQNMN